MPTIRTPADLVNLALARIGRMERVGHLYEGSKAAKVALRIYGQTRDQILRQNAWDFANRDINLALLKSAPPDGYAVTPWTPAYPTLPWLFEYAYPADCIKILALKRAPAFFPNVDPRPVVMSVSNDGAQKVLLCNIPDAIATYTGRVTDPSLWEPGFVEAFSAALGRRLAPSLSGMEAAKLEVSDEGQETAIAASEEG